MYKYLLALALLLAPAWTQTVVFTVPPASDTVSFTATAVLEATEVPALGDETLDITLDWDDGAALVVETVTGTLVEGAYEYTWSGTHEFTVVGVYTVSCTIQGSEGSSWPAPGTESTVQVNAQPAASDVPRQVWYVIWPTLRQPWIDAPMELGQWMFQPSPQFRSPLFKGGPEP